MVIQKEKDEVREEDEIKESSEKEEDVEKDVSFEETKLESEDTRTFTQVLQGTPSLDYLAINYENIVNNHYKPLLHSVNAWTMIQLV